MVCTIDAVCFEQLFGSDSPRISAWAGGSLVGALLFPRLYDRLHTADTMRYRL